MCLRRSLRFRTREGLPDIRREVRKPGGRLKCGAITDNCKKWAPTRFWHDRTAPDTVENQAAYPQQSVQQPGCGFPIIHIVALLSLATGMLVRLGHGKLAPARSRLTAKSLG